jgi:hypothetical protein
MKLLLLVALAASAALVAGQCDYDSNGVSGQALHDAISLCLSGCDAGALPQRNANETTNPVTLVAATNGVPDNNQTRFINDQLLIVVDESLKYYGKQARADLVFGNCATQGGNTTIYAIPNPPTVSGSNCKRTWTLPVNWNAFYAAFKAGGTQAGCGALVEESVDDGVVEYTEFTVSAGIINYEMVTIVRPSGTSYVERTIRHAVTLKLRFTRTASILTTIQSFAQLAPVAAITQQSVSVDPTFDGLATATIQLYTSIQDPFVIDDLRIDNTGSGVSDITHVSGDMVDDMAATNPQVNVVPFSGCSNSAVCTDYIRDNFYSSTTGTVGRAAVGNGTTCVTTDGNNNCFQFWQLRLRIGSVSSVCNFNGVYRVKYTVRCNVLSTQDANNECPINIDETAPGTDKRVVQNQYFDLTITSSNHCPTVVATISLSSALYTHAAPAADMGAVGINTVTGELDTSVNGGGVYPRPQSGGPVGYILGGTYSTSGTGLNARPSTFTTSSNSKDDFLQGQIVIGVARTVIGEATVTRADFQQLTITHPNAGTNPATVTSVIIADGVLNAAFQHDSASYGALKFLKVADTTVTRAGQNPFQGGDISTPYFAFVIDTATLNIGADQNAQVTIAGVVRVTYQSAGASLGAELASIDMGRATLFNLGSADGNRVRANINVGGSSGSAGSGAAASEATVLGVSANVAAGAALAAGLVVGVLVGVLVMTLLGSKPAPKRSESQVQLTGPAV